MLDIAAAPSRSTIMKAAAVRKRTSPVDLAVGQRVRGARLEKGLSQMALAEHIGVTFQQLQKYEKGKNRISVAKLLQLAATLDIPAAALLGDSAASPEASLGERMVATRQGCAMAQAWEEVSSSKARAALIDMAGMMKGVGA